MKGKHTLRTWRRHLDLSQQELGEKVGLSNITISAYEREGMGSSNIHNIIKIIEVLNIDFDQLDLELEKGME